MPKKLNFRIETAYWKTDDAFPGDINPAVAKHLNFLNMGHHPDSRLLIPWISFNCKLQATEL